MNNIKIVVISMPSSIERRKFIEEQFLSLNLPFIFFDAVVGASKEHNELKNYNNKRRLWEKGHSLTFGEQGCFASHKEIWKLSVANQESIIVIEDDAVISDDFMKIYTYLNSASRKYDFIRLGRGYCRNLLHFLPKYILLKKIDSIYSINKYLKGPSCTHGYFITPSAAMSFIEHSNTWHWPVDDYIDKEYIHNVPSIGIEPPVVLQSDLPSEIGGVKKPHRSQLTRIRKEYFRYKENTLNDIKNITFLIKSKLK